MSGSKTSKVPVIWLTLREDTLARGQFDDTFLEDLLNGKFGDYGYQPEHIQLDFSVGVKDIPEGGAIVVIHSRHHKGDVRPINQILNTFDWCLVILVGDEEHVFPWEQLKHPNMKIWAMDPKPGNTEARPLINGYAPAIRDFKGPIDDKPLDWFFSGQLGHEKREQMFEATKEIPRGEAIATKGFTQGLKPNEYYEKLASAKLALCPTGPHMPDSFRLWESLELGCVPIVEHLPSKEGYPSGFWNNLVGEAPFVFIDDWSILNLVVEKELKDWKSRANECAAWWKRLKRKYVKDLESDLYELCR